MKRLLNIPLGLLIALTTQGCALLMGSLPRPGPIFSEAVNYPAEPRGCLSPQSIDGAGIPTAHHRTVPTCDGATERVAAYLARYLPSNPEHLSKKLGELEFSCRKPDTHVPPITICEYKMSRGIVSCMQSYSTYVVVKYDAAISLVKDLHTEVSVGRGDAEMRGYMPL